MPRKSKPAKHGSKRAAAKRSSYISTSQAIKKFGGLAFVDMKASLAFACGGACSCDILEVVPCDAELPPCPYNY